MLGDDVGIPRDTVAAIHGLHERLRRLIVEQDTGDAIDDRIQCTTRAKGHRGPSQSRCLDRGQAKVFLAREDERAATGHVVGHLRIGQIAQKADVGARQRLKRAAVATAADDVQR